MLAVSTSQGYNNHLTLASLPAIGVSYYNPPGPVTDAGGDEFSQRADDGDRDRPLEEVEDEHRDADPPTEDAADVRRPDVATPRGEQIDAVQSAGEVAERHRPDEVAANPQERDGHDGRYSHAARRSRPASISTFMSAR